MTAPDRQPDATSARLAEVLADLGGPIGGDPVVDIPDWQMLRATWLRDFGEDW